MKRFHLAAIVLLISAFAMAEHNYMSFVDDVTSQMSITNLGMKISGDQLIASNGIEVRTFDLSTLKKMYFSDQEGNPYTAIEDVTADGGAVTVFTILGVRVATFSNLDEARQSLTAGTYIVSQGQRAIKMVVL